MLQRSLEGKIAIVTGASQGIGRAIAERLAGEGANVIVGYIDDAQKASEVVRLIEERGGRAVSVEADVRRPDSVKNLFDEALGHWGNVDIAIANAGVNLNKPVLETTDEDFERIFSVNARGTFFVFREAAKRIRDGGRIVGVSTNMTIQARPGIALYAGSKAAVEQFVKVLARELGSRMITVNAVAPGPTDTAMVSKLSRDTAPAATPFGRLGEPGDIADVVAFLASPESRWVNGQIIGVNGGLA
jgi:3-oxoacyl-[acyl-carrier protein] reductase